jgi:hypothetical protein
MSPILTPNALAVSPFTDYRLLFTFTVMHLAFAHGGGLPMDEEDCGDEGEHMGLLCVRFWLPQDLGALAKLRGCANRVLRCGGSYQLRVLLTAQPT